MAISLPCSAPLSHPKLPTQTNRDLRVLFPHREMSCSPEQQPLWGKLCLNVHNINAITWKIEQNVVNQLVILSSSFQTIGSTGFVLFCFFPLNWQDWVVLFLVPFPRTGVSSRRMLHLQAKWPSPKIPGMLLPPLHLRKSYISCWVCPIDTSSQGLPQYPSHNYLIPKSICCASGIGCIPCWLHGNW